MTPRFPIVKETAQLRARNQVTVPQPVIKALGLWPGDRVVFVVREGQAGEAHLHRMPTNFAGVARDAYAGRRHGSLYVRAEREAWER